VALHVDIVAVEAKVWSGDADMLVARTTEGELAILAGHAPMLGQLADIGEVRVKLTGGGEQAYEVDGGFLAVSEEGVTVLAETASPASGDRSR
jgi:F-type H+-transporting ATPase subunit epsilon